MTTQSTQPTIGANAESSRDKPRYWLNLLKAARLIEAHSHYDESANEYHVDPYAMAHLCAAIGNRKLSTLKT